MSNPYESPTSVTQNSKPWYRRPFVIAGLSCMAVGVALFVTFVVMLISAWVEVQYIQELNPNISPDELSKRLVLPLFFMAPAFVLGLIGIGLTIAGFYSKTGKG